MPCHTCDIATICHNKKKRTGSKMAAVPAYRKSAGWTPSSPGHQRWRASVEKGFRCLLGRLLFFCKTCLWCDGGNVILFPLPPPAPGRRSVAGAQDDSAGSPDWGNVREWQKALWDSPQISGRGFKSDLRREGCGANRGSCLSHLWTGSVGLTPAWAKAGLHLWRGAHLGLGPHLGHPRGSDPLGTGVVS